MKDVPSGTDRNKADTLPMLDEILEIAPALEANWAAEHAAFPPGTLLNDGTEVQEPAGGDGGEPEGEPSGEPDGGSEESFLDSFDLESVPPEARPHVEALQKEWQGSYTKRRQAEAAELAEVRRTAEQNQALIEGLANPETLPHYFQLLGVDLSDAELLKQLGVDVGQLDEGLDGLLGDEEPDTESRVEKLERERAEDKQEEEAAKVEEALDNLADTELERIEGEWDRKLDEDEDAFIRFNAERNLGPDGLPDYDSAAKLLKGLLGRREQEWAEERKKGGNGRGTPGGKPGGKALDPTKDEDRLALGTAAAERAMASQQ